MKKVPVSHRYEPCETGTCIGAAAVRSDCQRDIVKPVCFQQIVHPGPRLRRRDEIGFRTGQSQLF